MLCDFLNHLNPVLSEEAGDYRDLCARLASYRPRVSFMPSVTFDLWPVYVLQCTDARQFLDGAFHEMVYIISTGAHDFFFLPMLQDIVERFYEDDEAEIPNAYGADLDQMLLLECEPMKQSSAPRRSVQGADVVYMGFHLPGGSYAHLFFVADQMLPTWKTVFEAYALPCAVLIDSHKGLGDWFDTTDLYRYFNHAAQTALFPKLYFKGKYISHAAPDGYTLLHTVTESRPDECVSRLYRTTYGDSGVN